MSGEGSSGGIDEEGPGGGVKGVAFFFFFFSFYLGFPSFFWGGYSGVATGYQHSSYI